MTKEKLIRQYKNKIKNHYDPLLQNITLRCKQLKKRKIIDNLNELIELKAEAEKIATGRKYVVQFIRDLGALE